MAKPSAVIGTQSPNSLLQYPLDLTSMPYFTSLHFVRYVRPTGSADSRFDPNGNLYFPLPLQIQENYSIRHNARSLSLAGNDLKDLTEVGQTLADDIGHTITNPLKWNGWSLESLSTRSALRDAALRYGKYALLLTPKRLRDTAPFNRAVQIIGSIRNPHMAMIFDGVDLRQHTFTWTFSPRSLAESNRLHQMINSIRRHAHPRFTPGLSRFSLDFPDQVYMNFLGSDFVYPIKRSVIESIVVDDTQGGQPIWYAGGAPVFIGLTIKLSETEILTEDDFPENLNYTTDGSYASASVGATNTPATPTPNYPGA